MIATANYEPYLKSAKCFSTWLRLRILMGISMFLCLLVVVVSGVQTSNSPGDLINISASYPVPPPSLGNGTNPTQSPTMPPTFAHGSFANWNLEICQSTPLIYLRPFYFKYKFGGKESTMAAYCAWSDDMTSFRLVGSIFMFLLIILLFFHTRVSRFARSFLLFGFLFFFSCFFLDSNHSMTGMQSCLNKFENTVLGDYLDANNIDVNCYESSYAFTIFVDLIMFIVFFLLFECWGMCPDLYNGKFKEVNSTIDPHAQISRSELPQSEYYDSHNDAGTRKVDGGRGGFGAGGGHSSSNEDHDHFDSTNDVEGRHSQSGGFGRQHNNAQDTGPRGSTTGQQGNNNNNNNNNNNGKKAAAYRGQKRDDSSSWCFIL